MKSWLVVFFGAFVLTLATVIALSGLEEPMLPQEIAVVFILWVLLGLAVAAFLRHLRRRKARQAHVPPAGDEALSGDEMEGDDDGDA